MLTGKEIHVLDINSEFYGIPTSQLMENAGKRLSDFIINKFKMDTHKILFFCGIGNNGGDGFVAARYLSTMYNITVFLVGKEQEIKTDISKTNFEKLKKLNLKIYDIDSLNNIDKLLLEHDIFIDSMLGIGLSRNLKEPYCTVVKKINSTKNKTIISADVPTGFGTNLSIKPDITITFHDTKTGMNKENSGEIKIVDIGIPKKAVEYVGPGELITFYPLPKKESHKGDNGRLLVIGGGPYIGAPALSALAALRIGVDLTYIATPKKPARSITSFSPLLIKPERLAKEISEKSPNLIVKELNHEEKLVLDDFQIISSLLTKIDTIVIGPGLGSDKETQQTIEKILKETVKQNKSIVIDADAIQVVGQKPDLIRNTQTVITPHAGEFKELTNVKLSDDLNERKRKIQEWAKKLGVIILLKGQIDVISSGIQTKLNDIHNQGMTVGGTGDVLAGIIGGLLSKKVEPFNAARIGVFVNGAAGNIAYEKYSYGLIATDIIEEIPNVLKKYLQNR